MSTHTLKIMSLAIFILLAAGSGVVFGQYVPTPQDAMNRRMNPYDRLQDRRAAEEQDRMLWEAEQRRLADLEAARQEKIRERPSIPRRTEAGIQSPKELNEKLEALQPGQSIELHGDLFTAFDGMILSATYYRGKNGKDSVPVVLLHGKGGSRADFTPIIPALVEKGMAVLVPDIRGHGKSIEFIVEEWGEQRFFEIPREAIPANPFGANWLLTRWNEYQNKTGRISKPQTTINMKRIDKYEDRDFASMVFDLQVWQNFLINENNQERLNLKKLNLVGTEMGAGLAAVWCFWDQNTNGMKQTKTLTLISPIIPKDSAEVKRGNYIPIDFMNNAAMRTTLSTMIIVGKNNERALADAEKVKEILVGKGKKDEEPGLKATYPLIQCNTEKQGRDLFALTSAKIDAGIPLFILDRLAKLEAVAAGKKNDKSLEWTAGSWNKKPAPPPEKPAARPATQPAAKPVTTTANPD